MIIERDSPLRNLPARMERKQVLFFDGMRVSVQMAELTLDRLRSILLNLALDQIPLEHKGNALTLAMLDAWSIVDAIYRLRCLLQQLPGMKQKSPTLRLFYDRTNSIGELRNGIQHLNHEIDKLTAGEPVWGRLRWLTVKSEVPFLVCSSTVVMGALFDSTHPFINPAGKATLRQVDDITISANGQSVVFEPVFDQMAKVIKGIETSLRNQFTGVPTTSSDTMISMLIEFEPLDGTTPATT